MNYAAKYRALGFFLKIFFLSRHSEGLLWDMAPAYSWQWLKLAH